MTNRKQVLSKFYGETITKTEKERKKFTAFNQVQEAFDIIQTECRERLKALELEAE